MNVTTVKLSQLVPDPVINSRITGQKDGIKELATNIEEVGLILPLAVRAISGDTYSIIDGHRRYAALKLFKGDDDDVPVLVQDVDDTYAQEMSLAANIMRLPLHPADQYEAFKALVDKGVDVEDVATRFSVTVKDVKQRLALGSVQPSVLDYYRSGELTLDAVSTAIGTLRVTVASLRRPRRACRMWILLPASTCHAA
jgi:ParB family transcriptional regulator, chromosome partitioning protein